MPWSKASNILKAMSADDIWPYNYILANVTEIADFGIF